MKRRLLCLTLALVLALPLSACAVLKSREAASGQKLFKQGRSSYAFRTNGGYLERYNGSTFERFYVEGVNIGSGKPNYFPGEMGITKGEYLEWFGYISEMHANAVRVYTVLSPDFYDALYEFNSTHDSKLYLFQGCWYDEDTLDELRDVYRVMDSVKKDLKDLADIIHGRAQLKERAGHASGKYTRDISQYVAGWILGIEPDAELVEATNALNREITGYSGEYLTCEGVQPYEAFWCQIGDYVLSYEDKTYHTQRLVSFTNWPTTDVMEHPNEPLMAEDAVSLNAETIRSGERFFPGVFASYHVYPHYPNFMFIDAAYKDYVDETGRKNPYRAYLEDLLSHHDYPVLIAEFGVPASRGVAHINPVSGYNQGGHTEESQGEKLVSMFEDIRKAGCAGGLVFSWQDEWFKKVWNTSGFNDPERRAYWNDMQTCEQHYGLMEFVSVEDWPPTVIDGKAGDWTEESLVWEGADGARIHAKANSTYLYLMVKVPSADWSEKGKLIYFDVTPEVGSKRYGDAAFETGVDLVLDVGGRDDTRLMIHRDSDIYHYINDIYDPGVVSMFKKSPDGFGPVYLILDYEHVLPQTWERVPVQRIETGLLHYGSTDEASEDYSTLADFCYDGEVLEVRLPWQLLGFRDPSRKEVQGYFTRTKMVGGVCVDGITVGLATPEGDMGRGFFTWENWVSAAAYPRLRRSYYMVREYLAKK